MSILFPPQQDLLLLLSTNSDAGMNGKIVCLELWRGGGSDVTVLLAIMLFAIGISLRNAQSGVLLR